MISPVCSTAFAAKYQGREVMLTADHCFSPGSGIERYVVDSTGGGRRSLSVPGFRRRLRGRSST